MNHHITLILAALLASPTLFAQGGTTPPSQVPVEERIQVEETITVEPVPEPPSPQGPDEVFTVVEVMPEFPGGKDALFTYIGKNLKYPEEAVENGVQGVVFVTFVVETDGKITGASILRGLGGALDKEALRVVSGMPNWTPGMQAGKAVRVKYNLPIRFKLAEDKK